MTAAEGTNTGGDRPDDPGRLPMDGAEAAGPTAHDRRSLRLLVAAVVAITALTRLPGLVSARAFNTDEATLAVLGRTLSGPGTMYVDAADHKPPLAFAAYGFVQRLTGSDDLRYVRGLVALLVIATALVVAVEARDRWGDRAMWVGGMAVVLTAAALGPADAQAANFEMFTLLPIAVAVVAGRRNEPWVAGAAVAVAALAKQPAAVTAIPVAVALWQQGRLRALLRAAAAGLLATTIIVIPFGPGRVLEWALLRNDGYLSLDAEGLTTGAVRLLAMAGLGLAFWCGVWLLVVGAWTRPRRRELARWPDLDLWLLLAVSLAATLPGLRFFPHYLIGAVPAVALLAAKGAARRPTWIRPAVAATAVASTVALGLAWYETSLPVERGETEVAAYISANTDPTDKVLVWGNLPEIYWRADRLPAGALTHNNLLTAYSGRKPQLTTDADLADRDLYEEYVDRVREDRPALIVDIAAADIRGGEFAPLEGYELLQDFVDTDYEQVADLDGVIIYRRGAP